MMLHLTPKLRGGWLLDDRNVEITGSRWARDTNPITGRPARFSQLRRMAASHVGSNRSGSPGNFALAAMNRFADATALSSVIVPLAAMQSDNLARMDNIAVMDHTTTKW
jgi:hypothetical protein